ncbi:NAD(P)(+) transhydrogenase (Re/Si-specific) subunit beta [Puniceicoccus vermicola]|uniref:NAD(P) transhydrogenase subunit beta n=1 Tax=Puniceicoccus vermicola TaxID=388746 RepID=A0A7X1AX32_9BACT|nr:NAD(P)(+) transhydrogenase (Re/Si-specific) subunit beta [Puniceicoccus vermicola]MBC2601601.1 NAD(P)(+) transhydrogenase (Re/Si-specific) subunit beta [Puniceicoccus vermicola]
MSAVFLNIAYIAAAVLFIFGIKMLGSASTARKGNMISAIGMLLAVVVTLMKSGMDFQWVWIGLGLGTVIGVVWARVVKMTGMPELVALFNGFGGLASVFVAWAEYQKYFSEGGIGGIENATFIAVVIAVATWIGALTFSGSLIAWAKLSGKLGGSATILPKQRLIALVLLILSVGSVAFFGWAPDSPVAYGVFLGVLVAGIGLGIFGVLPIGGGDMPVVISLLNSLSGLAASAAGFAIQNNVLIVAGCLVGCSGLILTLIMCKAMNRNLANVLFSGFGSAGGAADTEVEGEMKAATTSDAYYVLEAAQTVVIIPGYGMAVAQAQHAVKELGDLLEENGAEVFYAIHPVAGRMPGHMNVLLAEADVPYEQLVEMDAINPRMPSVDVAIVIGANDVVNPAASEDQSSPIYGMPIIKANEARTVYALKRGKGAGFSGLVNKLYFLEKTRMLYGDAKETVTALVSEFKK